jgi:hypothetical protein
VLSIGAANIAPVVHGGLGNGAGVSENHRGGIPGCVGSTEKGTSLGKGSQ